MDRRKSLIQRWKKRISLALWSLECKKIHPFLVYRSIHVNSYPAIIINKGTARFQGLTKHPGSSAVSLCPQPTQQTPPSFCRWGCDSAESLNRPTSIPGYSCLSVYMSCLPHPKRPTSPPMWTQFVRTPIPTAGSLLSRRRFLMTS